MKICKNENMTKLFLEKLNYIRIAYYSKVIV